MPLAVWKAYQRLDKVKSNDPVELTALVSLHNPFAVWITKLLRLKISFEKTSSIGF